MTSLVRSRARRATVAGITVLGPGVGAGLLHPVVGVAFAVTGLALVIIVIGTALFGTPALSERAFRLLGWVRNRPGAYPLADAGATPSPGAACPPGRAGTARELSRRDR
jgi:hypothetical protein